MKRIVLLLAIFLPTLALSQVVVSGFVTTNSGGSSTVMTNYPVQIQLMQGGSAFVSTAYTNANGFYIDTLATSVMGNAYIAAYINDCNGSINSDSIGLNPGTSSVQMDFIYCDTNTQAGACSPNVITSVNGSLVYQHISNSNPTSSYSWTLPNGTTTSGTSATYNVNAIGLQSFCVTTTDSVLGCNSTVCDSFFVNTLTPCDSTFSTSVNGNVVTHSMNNPSWSADYTWTLPNGNIVMGPQISYTVNSTGNFNVCVDVYDSLQLCNSTGCDTFNINNLPPVSCDSSFTTSISGTMVTHSMVNPVPGATYAWILPNGATQNGTQVSYTMSASGTYQACVTVSNSAGAGSCMSTGCDTFLISSNPMGCDTNFTTQVTGNNVTHFMNNPSPTATYTWFLPNNQTATGAQVSYSLNVGGNYGVCVQINDSINNCFTTACDSFLVSGGTGGNCDTSFTTTVNGATIYHSMDNPSASATYTWTLPNGNTATGPLVSYNGSGMNPAGGNIYTVCVTVTDSLSQCTATGCDDFTYLPAGTGNSISGQINYSNASPVQAAVVYLIETDTSAMGQILTAVDSTYTSAQGLFAFQNVAMGSYYIKAALLPSDAQYGSYLPSYYDSNAWTGVLYWSNGTPVVPTWNYVNYNLIQGNNPGGPGFVGGLVSQGANKTEGAGDPLEGVSILLTDQNGNAVASTTSGNDGRFEFSNLAIGDYTVYPEVPGVETFALDLTLTALENSVNNVGVKIHSSYAEAFIDATVGVEERTIQGLEVYPNPVMNDLTIQLDELNEDEVIITLTDLSGKVIALERSTHQFYTLPMSNLQSGVYLVRIQTENAQATYKIMKL